MYHLARGISVIREAETARVCHRERGQSPHKRMVEMSVDDDPRSQRTINAFQFLIRGIRPWRAPHIVGTGVHNGHVVVSPPLWQAYQPIEPFPTDRLAYERDGFRQHDTPHPIELRTWDVPCDLFGHPQHFFGVAVPRPASRAPEPDQIASAFLEPPTRSPPCTIRSASHSIQISDDRFQCRQIPVDVRDDGDARRAPLATDNFPRWCRRMKALFAPAFQSTPTFKREKWKRCDHLTK